MPDRNSQLALITPIGGGGRPDNELPPPEISWPPGNGHPPYPDQGLPGGGNVGTPEHPIVIPPYVDNTLPPSIWPGVPIHPGTPEHPISGPPGSVYPPLPPLVDKPAAVLVWIPGVGYRWVVLVPQPK